MLGKKISLGASVCAGFNADWIPRTRKCTDLYQF